MKCSIWLALLICLTAACSPDSEDSEAQVLARDAVSSDPAVNSGSCSIVPTGFRSFHEFASNRSDSSGSSLKNVIKIRADRSITWNGDDVSKSMLEDNLRMALRFYPAPLTILDFDAGTPCPMINEVRELMRTHLDCGNKAVCFQGDGRF